MGFEWENELGNLSGIEKEIRMGKVLDGWKWLAKVKLKVRNLETMMVLE